MAEEIVTKQMQLLPEYQEKFLKDLLANVFQVDEETGTISGIAATSPLYGTPVLDEAGNQMYIGADGSYVSDPSLAATDQYGEPIFATEGGVAAPDVIGFTDAQIDAIRRMTGYTDPETGEVVYEGMMGLYQPYLDKAEEYYGLGKDAVAGSMGRYDPLGQIVYDTDPVTGEKVARIDPTTGEPVREGGYKDFYDPFVEDVLDTTLADITRQADIERNRLASEGLSQGAFGGSRQAVAEQELTRNALAEMAGTGAKLRSAAYTGAQEQAQNAFENQMKRGQTAGELFQGLGTGLGALGEAAQSLGFKDVNTLFNTGLLEQKQLQSEYDVQRAAQLEEAYEPFARFSYMRDILQGLPTSGTGLAATGTPKSGGLGQILEGANVISAGQGGGNIFGGLGDLYTT